MNKKLKKMDLRDVSLMIRTSVDEMELNDLRLYVLLGFFHRSFLKIINKLNFNFDTTILEAEIMNVIKNRRGEQTTEMNYKIQEFNLSEILSILQGVIDESNAQDMRLTYMFGFSHGILNRIMRKIGINYQIPRPF